MRGRADLSSDNSRVRYIRYTRAKKDEADAIGGPSTNEIKRRIKSSMTNERPGKLFLMIPVCAPARDVYMDYIRTYAGTFTSKYVHESNIDGRARTYVLRMFSQ